MSRQNQPNDPVSNMFQTLGNVGKKAIKKVGAKAAKKLSKTVLKKVASGLLLKTAPIWGSILGIVLIVLILISILTPDLSSGKDRFGNTDEAIQKKISEYIEIGTTLGINPLWVVAFDMVVHENENLLDYDTDDSSYYFFSVYYEKFKPSQIICTKYSEEEGKENECIESYEEPEKILESGTYNTKEEIQSFFRKQGQNPKDIMTALENIRAKDNVRITTTALTPEVALANGNFDEEQQEYFNDILESGLIEEEYPQFADLTSFWFGSGAYCSPNKEINEAQWNSAFAKAGELSTYGPVFIEKAKKYGIDPVIFAAISFHETTYGKSKALRTKNNPGGLMGSNGLMVFSSIEDGLESMAKTLHNRIIKDGLTTIEKLGSRYAPIGAANDPTGLNKHWVPNVSKIASQLGGLTMNCEAYGNGMDIVFDGDVSQAAQIIASSGFKYIGKSKYVFGGGRSQSDIALGRFDCSSFVHWAYLQAGINLGPLTSTSTETLNKMGKRIPISEIKVGDILFWDTYKKDGHVGIYIGNGKFIGSQSSTGVAIVNLNNSYYNARFSGHVRRLLPDN